MYNNNNNNGIEINFKHIQISEKLNRDGRSNQTPEPSEVYEVEQELNSTLHVQAAVNLHANHCSTILTMIECLGHVYLLLLGYYEQNNY